MTDPEITVKLTLSKLNVIIAALGKRPLEEVVDVWMTLKQQGEQQIAVKPEQGDSHEQPGSSKD